MSKAEEKLANELLITIMKDEPMKLIKWMLLIVGQEMADSNAGTLDMSQEMTLNKKRYEVFIKAKLTDLFDTAPKG